MISFAPASLASSVNASPFAGVTPKRKSRPPHHPGSPFPHHDRRHQRLHPASGHQRTSAPTDDLEDEVESGVISPVTGAYLPSTREETGDGINEAIKSGAAMPTRSTMKEGRKGGDFARQVVSQST